MHPISTLSEAELLSFRFLEPEAVSDSEPHQRKYIQSFGDRLVLPWPGGTIGGGGGGSSSSWYDGGP